MRLVAWPASTDVSVKLHKAMENPSIATEITCPEVSYHTLFQYLLQRLVFHVWEYYCTYLSRQYFFYTTHAFKVNERARAVW